MEGDVVDAERVGAARGLVDGYLGLYAGHLLLRRAHDDERKRLVARRHIAGVLAAAVGAVEALRLGVFRTSAHPDDICG